jgi:pyruvate/2-oxoglutarate dehydrogenase complex dihydrolipoamide dehydrogenase (E3) component
LPREKFDVIIIGTGQGGGPLSTAFGKAGRRVAIVERGDVGGTCINTGCTPTKTMVASARVAHLARRGGDYGVRIGEISVDMKVVRQRKRDIVDSFRSGSESRIVASEGVELIMGEAAFVGQKEVDVNLNAGGTRQLAADTIIIDTGTRPAEPPLEGLSGVLWLDSTSIMELDEVPEHLLVIGGGYVGLEFGQMFHRFGSHVTIVQRGPRLLTREDADVAEELLKILREDGLDILMETGANRVAQGGDGRIHLHVRGPEGERELVGTHLLVATGRVPNTDQLRLEKTGVRMDERGYIPVNDRLETNVPGIYAIGDVNGGPQLTHISWDDFRVVRANLLEGGNKSTKERMVPYTVFTDPQLGHVGIGEEEARRQGREIKVAKMPISSVARVLEVDEPRGFLKVIVDAGSGQILGCAMLGIEGGELMGMIEIAMMGKLTAADLRDGVYAHPTLTEAMNNLFSSI